jgi:tryptophan synthase alpha chain
MPAIDDLFSSLRAARRKALMPFITAGDPDLDFTQALVRELASRGADLCEIGFPYSDPIADGPVIQASYTRALDKKTKVADILGAMARVELPRPMPLVAMVSYAIIYRQGIEKFVATAQRAGLAGAIVPDLPAEESKGLAKLCRASEFSLIQLITPTTTKERALRIADSTTGFIYYVSVAGITGERAALPSELIDNVAWLRGQTELPICVGFGISTPDHVRQLAQVADGLIVGSAIVRRVAEAATRPRADVLREIGDYVASLIAALPK